MALALVDRMLASAAHADLAIDEDVHAIDVPADPNGLAYDRGTLYVADGATGAVLAVDGRDQGRRRYATAISQVTAIDAGGAGASNQLGGLAIAPDGTLFVVRLGHGCAGAIFRVARQGDIGRAAPAPLAGLCPRVWRLGVYYDAGEHALYATQYAKQAAAAAVADGKRTPCDGSVIRIALATGAVTTAVGGLVKPVGVTKLGHTLVISDGKQRSVLAATPDGRVRELVRLADRPDSLTACGPDSVLVSTFAADTQIGSVRRLWLDGRAQLIAQGRWEPRGVATDGERVFVAARRAGRVLVFPL